MKLTLKAVRTNKGLSQEEVMRSRRENGENVIEVHKKINSYLY